MLAAATGKSISHSGIARELAAAVRPGCWKLKWRVTLFQDPRSDEPTTYKVEGTLYGSNAREGQWRTRRGAMDDPSAMVYELLPNSQHRRILLSKGDDNVLFLLDQSRRPLVGTAQNTCTLDRRTSYPDRSAGRCALPDNGGQLITADRAASCATRKKQGRNTGIIKYPAPKGSARLSRSVGLAALRASFDPPPPSRHLPLRSPTGP